jgi:hypothetical protein
MEIRRYRRGEEGAVWSVYFAATHESNARDYHPDLIERWAPHDQDMGRWAERPGTAGQTDQPWGHSSFVGKPIDPGSPTARFPFYYGPVGLAHMTITDWAKFIALHLRGDPANPRCRAALLKLDTFAELHAVAPTATYSKGWVMRGLTCLVTGDGTPAVAYRAGAFISSASWAKGIRPGDTGRCLRHGGSNGVSHSVACIAPEIDFAVLVACNRGLDIALWKTRQAARALIRAFAPKRTS